MGYAVPVGEARFEQTIKKSRFIGVASRVTSAEDVERKLRNLRDEFPDATHHCSAYRLGDPASTSQARADDDGEPSGTAGRPILNVLQHRNVGDVLVVVVRYFGGVKLGAGGLVRAYSSTTSGVLNELETAVSTPFREGTIGLAYADEALVSRILDEVGVMVLDRVYGEEVALRVRVPESAWDDIAQKIADATSGRARIHSKASLYDKIKGSAK